MITETAIHIDDDFSNLIPPLTAEELAQLEHNLIADGCREPLVVWAQEGILLDGHNRYRVCTKHDIPFDVREISLSDRDAAMCWVIRNQFGRRNLTPYQRAELALKLKPLIAAQAREKQREAGGAVPQKSAEAPVETRQELARIAGVSHDTIRKAEFLQEHADEKTKQELREGKVSINQAHREAAREVRQLQRTRTRVEPPPLDDTTGRFQLVYADPPWRYDFSTSDSRQIENQYETLEVDKICALAVPTICEDDCVLLLWATSPKLPEALKVMQAWGFTYKTCMVWVKDRIGMGYYARQRHELLLIGVKGSPPVPTPEARPDSVVCAPRGRHSEKPDRFAEIVEAMYPNASRVELFARKARPNWSAWGNETI
jgi:N6-adenosine-specific RNA methylase IME4